MQTVVIFSGPSWAPGAGIFAFVHPTLTEAFRKEFPSAEWDDRVTAWLLPMEEGLNLLLWKTVVDPEKRVKPISTAQFTRLLAEGVV